LAGRAKFGKDREHLTPFSPHHILRPLSATPQHREYDVCQQITQLLLWSLMGG